MVTTVTIQDFSEPIGSRLWSGSKVYLYCSNITYGMKINNGTGVVNMASVDNVDSDSGSNNLNFSRRKARAQYVGINNPTINMDCAWEQTLGSYQDGEKIFTPYKLLQLSLKPRVVYLLDDNIYTSLANGEDGEEGYYTGSGIPIFLEDYDIDVNVEKNLIYMKLNFIEEKEVSDER